jgi:hypothetical protein
LPPPGHVAIPSFASERTTKPRSVAAIFRSGCARWPR